MLVEELIGKVHRLPNILPDHYQYFLVTSVTLIRKGNFLEEMTSVFRSFYVTNDQDFDIVGFDGGWTFGAFLQSFGVL